MEELRVDRDDRLEEPLLLEPDLVLRVADERQVLVQDVDYVVADGVVTILGDAAQRRIIRIGWLPE